MNNLYWNEMYDSKKFDIYLNKYVSFHKTVKKTINIITIILTSTSLIAWLSNRGATFTGIALGLSAFSKLLELLQNQFIASDEYLSDVSELRILWIEYYLIVQKIFVDFRLKKIDKNQAWDEYSRNSELKKKIEEKQGNTKIWIFWHLNKSSDKETTNYMRRYYEQTN